MITEGGAFDGEGLDLWAVAFWVGDCKGLRFSCILVVRVEVSEELSCEGPCEVDDHAGEVFLCDSWRGELDEAKFFVEDGECI